MQTNHSSNTITVKISPNDRGNPAGKLADAELHFGGESPLAGLKLIADAGLQAQTHAVGDETIDVIVRSYGRVNAEKSIRNLRMAGSWRTSRITRPRRSARSFTSRRSSSWQAVC